VSANSPVRKRSIVIRGHPTSITLEEVFWTTLKALARERGMSLQSLAAEIDRTRAGNLSSALRVFALKEVLKKTG